MKANELRLRNFVLFEGKSYIIYPHDIEYLDKNPDSDHYKPIPLTEEWLLKFGFDSLGDYGYGRGNFHICLHSNEFYMPINNKKIFVEYVHQLQNLYFALTGKELSMQL